MDLEHGRKNGFQVDMFKGSAVPHFARGPGPALQPLWRVGLGPRQHSRPWGGAPGARPRETKPTAQGPRLTPRPQAVGAVPFVGRPNARRAALHAEHVDGSLRGAEEPAEAQEGAHGHRRRGSPVLGHTAQGGPDAARGGRGRPDPRLPWGQQGPASGLHVLELTEMHPVTCQPSPKSTRRPLSAAGPRAHPDGTLTVSAAVASTTPAQRRYPLSVCLVGATVTPTHLSPAVQLRLERGSSLAPAGGPKPASCGADGPRCGWSGLPPGDGRMPRGGPCVPPCSNERRCRRPCGGLPWGPRGARECSVHTAGRGQVARGRDT